MKDSRCFNYAWRIIYVIGFIAVFWGILQVWLRYSHPLLPEDVKFTGLSLEDLSKNDPRLLKWLGLVMRAWGGFIFSTGVFTIYLAKHGIRNRQRWALNALAFGGIPMFTTFFIGNIILESQFLILIGCIFFLYCASLLMMWKYFNDEKNLDSL